VERPRRGLLSGRALYDGGDLVKSELTLAAERYLHGRRGIREQPRSGAERNWMRDRVDRARELLAEEGIHVTNADLQAIWWYPEKELYAKLGGEGTDALNYAGALADLVRKQGIADGQIQSAIRSEAGGPGSAGLSEARREGGRGIAPPEEGGEGAEGAAGLRDRGIGLGRHTPEPLFQSVGRGVGEGQEGAAGGVLTSAPVAKFHAAVQHAHDTHKFGSSVAVHSPQEYAGMKRYLAPDGSAGYRSDAQLSVRPEPLRRGDIAHSSNCAERGRLRNLGRRDRRARVSEHRHDIVAVYVGVRVTFALYSHGRTIGSAGTESRIESIDAVS
jgi:hypothetical protein